MFFIDVIFVFLIAILLTGLIGNSYRGRDGGGILLFFLIVFIGTWAIGLWIPPFGPVLFGVYWMSFLFIGLFIAFILAAIPNSWEQRSGEEASTTEETYIDKDAKMANKSWYGFNIFFWLLILFLIIVIIVAYTS